MRILISGASGFIGRPLSSYLQAQGHEVVALPRDWALSHYSLEGFEAVIHLAGEPLTIGRWSWNKRQKILESRKDGTAILCRALVDLRVAPQVFISASATGYYGDRGEEVLHEASDLGAGFLSQVCLVWEKASQVLAKRDIRAVQARFGMVLDLRGGVLCKLLPLYRLGLGGKLGSGEQWISWIARHDLLRALEHILRSDSLHGPVNLVSLHPIRQKNFAAQLAKALHRPLICSVPAWILKAALGIMAKELLLASQRVEPRKLQASGFAFQYPELEDILVSGQ